MYNHCREAPTTDSAGSLLSDPVPDQSEGTTEVVHRQTEEEAGEDRAMDTEELETLPPLPLPPSSSSSFTSSPTVPTQEDIVAFAEEYSLELASKRFTVPVSTIKKWVKSSWVPLKPKYNSPGQGRKISYSTELDSEMAEHVRDALARGESISIQSVCFYARGRVRQEVPEFNASTGWANRFLARHNITLTDQNKEHKKESLPPKDNRAPDSRGRPLSYSVETDQAIASYVRQKLADGYSLTNSELRRYAKEIIIKENSKFTGSASWAQNFLHRHKINLQSQDSKESATSASPSPTVSCHASPSLPVASSATPLLPATPLMSSQAQYTCSSSPLTSSPQFTSAIPGVSTVSAADANLNPATEMHVVASSSSTQGFPGSGLSDGVMSLPAEYGPDDPMKQALAILTGENIDASILSAEQLASLQSTLSELTSDTVSLVDLLNTAQQMHEQAAESGSGVSHLIGHGLDSPASAGLYLANSDVFGSGLTGAAATQVNPNTQTPTMPNPPRAVMQSDVDTNSSSRPLSYAKETDLILAKWVQEQQAAGKKVTFASLRAYAKSLVSAENPNFNASVGWVTPFLLRHGLDLSVNKKTSKRAVFPYKAYVTSNQASPSRPPPKPSVSHIMQQDEEPLTPEQMMIPPGQVVSSEASREHASSSMISTPATTSCSTATTLEGLRAVLEQGIQSITSDGTEQLQFAAQLQEQPLLLSQPPTSLSRVAPPGLPTDGIPVVRIDSEALGEGRPRRTRAVTQKYNAEEENDNEEKISVKKRAKGQRNRHRLSEKLDVVRLMREQNLAPHYVCRMMGIANSTMAGWIKLVQQKGVELEALSLNKKRSNISGQGRPLSYSKEKDEAIAEWIQNQQKLGVQVMPAELARYAQSLIREENANFTASSGWSQKFLQRHNLQLISRGLTGGGSVATPGNGGVLAAAECAKSSAAIVEDQQNIPAAVQTEEVVTHEYGQERPYSEETEKHLVEWVKENVSTNGSLSLQTICRYAEELVIAQNPMFVASLSWAFMFLHANKLLLDPKPNIGSVRTTPNPRKRTSLSRETSSEQAAPQVEQESTPKRPCPEVADVSVSPSTGNLCEALLALSSQPESSQSSNSSVQAVLQVALRALHQQQQQQQKQQQQQQELQVQMEGLVSEAATDLLESGSSTVESRVEEVGDGGTISKPREDVRRQAAKPAKGKGAADATHVSPEQKDSSSNTYFGKPAREFSVEEKEEVVRYANATTLQKAAIKYGVAAPTVWRWRVELKLHQPKYSAMQKKYIIKFAKTNSLKEAAQRYGITGKTISNWRKALQADGELSSDAGNLLTQESQADMIESSSGGDSQQSTTTNEVVFHFVVDGGEVVEVTGTVGGNVQDDREGSGDDDGDGGSGELGAQGRPTVTPAAGGDSGVALEVTNEVDIENVGMEYDVVSSEGHVAKPRCTPQEKVEILQYALEHSIKEASAKFGVSPGTLYYWKRSRNSGKENNSKEMISGSQGSAGPDRHSVAVPPVIEYRNVETNVLASGSEAGVMVQPEQFIVSSTGTATDVQTSTIHTLSQALAGMNASAIQHLNPELTLLQAVSSFLTAGGGGAGEQGGREEGEGREGGDNEGQGASSRNSEGISSPTEVLVRPFPPQKDGGSTDGGERNDGQEESRMEDTPHVVSEEVVMIGGDSEPLVSQEKATEEIPLKENLAMNNQGSISITAESGASNEVVIVPTSSERGSELQVLAFAREPSTLSDVPSTEVSVSLTQGDLPSSVNPPVNPLTTHDQTHGSTTNVEHSSRITENTDACDEPKI